MEEIKILVLALVSFLSTDDIPIGAKSAEIHIDRTSRQITVRQYDIFSVEQYRTHAKAGLDSLLRATALIEGMAPLKLTHTHFYEEEGRLNAAVYIHFDSISDLRKLSFYSDALGNLSYPYIENYEHTLVTGKVDGRFLRFDAAQDVKFGIVPKVFPSEGTFSLLDTWYQLQAEKYQDVSAQFSHADFKKLRTFILSKGGHRSFRNIENNNPYYQFEKVNAYLASSAHLQFDHSNPLAEEHYDTLVLWGNGQFNLYLGNAENGNSENPHLSGEKVYFVKSPNLKTRELYAYLKEIKEKLWD